MPSFDRSWQLVALLMLVIGGLILAGGVALGWNSFQLVLHGQRAVGEVVELRREDDMYAPVLRFALPGGEMKEVKDLATGSPDFAVGDKVGLFYSLRDPGDFRIDTFDRLWLSSILVVAFAGFWLLFGAVAWALSRGAEMAVVGESAFTLIAAAALIAGIWVLRDTWQLYTGGTRTSGTILEIRATRQTVEETVTEPGGRETRRDVSTTSYAPVVRFTTKEGREIEFQGRGGSDTPFAAGERVNVIYDPVHPANARIVSFVDLWFPAAVAFCVAFLFSGAAWLSRWSRRRSRSQGIS
ncbi:hypothetical protein BH11PSE3_BH11PSE3_07530 [soil metagenome]